MEGHRWADATSERERHRRSSAASRRRRRPAPAGWSPATSTAASAVSPNSVAAEASTMRVMPNERSARPMNNAPPSSTDVETGSASHEPAGDGARVRESDREHDEQRQVDAPLPGEESARPGRRTDAGDGRAEQRHHAPPVADQDPLRRPHAQGERQRRDGPVPLVPATATRLPPKVSRPPAPSPTAACRSGAPAAPCRAGRGAALRAAGPAGSPDDRPRHGSPRRVAATPPRPADAPDRPPARPGTGPRRAAGLRPPRRAPERGEQGALAAVTSTTVAASR